MTVRAAAVVLLGCCGAAQDQGPTEPLCRAALNGDIAQVRSLLGKGADPNVRDEDGETPLIRAASLRGRVGSREDNAPHSDPLSVIRLLLDKGAEVDARDRQGRTALLAAMEGSASEYRVFGGDLAIAKLLIERGANVNAQDNEG